MNQSRPSETQRLFPRNVESAQPALIEEIGPAVWEGRPSEDWGVVENGAQLIFNLPDFRSSLWYVLDGIRGVPSDKPSGNAS
jgi:hypothetical protein